MAYILIGTVTATNRRHLAEKVANLPEGHGIKVGPPTRSLAQNALLHSMFGELEAKAMYLGRKLTAHQWKALMVSGHSIAVGLPAEIICGIEGEFLNIRESSAQMSIARMTSLIEYIHAWASMNNVQLQD